MAAAGLASSAGGSRQTPEAPRLPQPSLDSWGSPGQGSLVPLINAGPKHFAQLLRGGRVKVVPHTMDSDLNALLLVISGKSNAHMAIWPVLRLRRLMSLCDRLADHFHLLTFSL